MIGSGLGILNAHPRLYWGQYGANFDHPWLDGSCRTGRPRSADDDPVELQSRDGAALASDLRAGARVRAARVHDRQPDQPPFPARPARAGEGSRAAASGRTTRRASPGSLSTIPTIRPRTTPCRSCPMSSSIFVLIPLMILTGLAMSPAMDAAWPWLLDMFGGRQSARSIHFIAAARLVGFIIVHLTLVILAGPVGEVRSMITGRWKLPEVPASRARTGARRMTLITRRALVGGGAAGAGLLLSGCDKLADAAGVPQDPVLGRQDQHGPAARAQRPRRARARIPRRPDVADLPRQRHAQSRHARLQRACRRHASPIGASQVGGLVDRPLSLSARRSRRDAAARADHAARLRRGMERDRQMAGADARQRAEGGGGARRPRATSSSPAPISTAARPITNRSTWSTPSTRRRSSPGR